MAASGRTVALLIGVLGVVGTSCSSTPNAIAPTTQPETSTTHSQTTVPATTERARPTPTDSTPTTSTGAVTSTDVADRDDSEDSIRVAPLGPMFGPVPPGAELDQFVAPAVPGNPMLERVAPVDYSLDLASVAAQAREASEGEYLWVDLPDGPRVYIVVEVEEISALGYLRLKGDVRLENGAYAGDFAINQGAEITFGGLEVPFLDHPVAGRDGYIFLVIGHGTDGGGAVRLGLLEMEEE